MNKKIHALSLVACSLAFAGEHWNVDAGAVTMKYLSMQVSARTAALSGRASPMQPALLMF